MVVGWGFPYFHCMLALRFFYLKKLLPYATVGEVSTFLILRCTFSFQFKAIYPLYQAVLLFLLSIPDDIKT